MNKIVLTIIITAIISSFITYKLTKNSIWTDRISIFQPIRKNNKIIVTPTEKPSPKYSVDILNTPITSDIFNLKVGVKNMSITPFITGIYLRECELSDNKGTKYKGSIDSPVGGYGIEYKFSKAILPGESQTINFDTLNLDVLGGGGVDRSGVPKDRCRYDDKGNKICKPIEGLTIEKCAVYTSTSGEYRGDFPLEVYFPK